MHLVRHPAYQFWLTIYCAPVMVPILFHLAFVLFVQDELEKAVGARGPILASKISLSLSATIIVMIVTAHLAAWWHASKGEPQIPKGTDQFPSVWRWAGRLVGRIGKTQSE